MEINDFIHKLSKDEFREFIAYCNAIYYDKYLKPEIADKMHDMKHRLVSMREKINIHNDLGPTGHGDICMSDADNYL